MENILIVRPDRVGDVIISSSSLAHVRKTFPEARIVFAAPAQMAPLYSDAPNFSFLPLESSLANAPFSGKDFRRAIALFRRCFSCENFSAAIFLHPSPPMQIAAWLEGIPRRIGFNQGLAGLSLTDGVAYSKHEGRKHEAEYAFDLLTLIGCVQPDALEPIVFLREADRVSLEKMIGQHFFSQSFFVVNPTAFSLEHRWRPERFAELVFRLVRPSGLLKGHAVAITGGHAGDPSVLALSETLLRQRVEFINLAGRTNLGELGHLLKKSRFLVTRNTGISHLAGAVGCPVADIFNRTEPIYGSARWRVLGETVEIVAHSEKRSFLETNPRYWRRALDSISVEEVESAVARLVSRIPKGGTA